MHPDYGRGRRMQPETCRHPQDLQVLRPFHVCGIWELEMFFGDPVHASGFKQVPEGVEGLI